MVWVKRVTRWWSSPLLLLASAVIIACGAVPEFPSGKICTLAGCSGGISVEITGYSLDQPYVVSLILPSGERINQVCDGSPKNDFEKSCTETGAYFALPAEFTPPETVTIEISINGKIHKQEYSPDYEKFQPNGEDCPPVCYNAALVFQMTK